jgi:Glycosyl transferase family 2
MGVKHLFFLDNGSTDGTVEALKGYDNSTVLRTGLPFNRYELSMRQYLVERFCQKGRWCLYADIDELFDYPYSDVVSLSSLLRYLNQRSYTAVVAQMLDMFPEEPLSGRASTLLDEPLKERHRFYDISNIQTKGIKEHGRNNIYESDDIEYFLGGIRSTLFGTKAYLTRFALMFSDGRLKPFAGSGHRVDNARVADLTCVYFHYKFLDEHFHKKVASAVREENYPYNSSQYKKYLEVLEKNPGLLVKGEGARELRSVNDLVENHFLVVSEEYLVLVYDEERKRRSGDAPRRGELGEIENENSYKAEAQAKARSLRTRRLERRLEELREQNQRLEQQLREQNQRLRLKQELREKNWRRVEKLSRRLARTKKRTKKKNQNLARQLRSMRASRSWRLLNRLARLQARVLGRIITKDN